MRAQLKTAIADMLTDLGMECHATEEGLVALAVALADYREEGVALFPKVVVCDDLSTVVPMLGGSAPIKIGGGAREASTMSVCLKKCAPLAAGGWAIWVERTKDRLDFGVFREPSGPIAIDLRTSIVDLGSTDVPVVLLDQVAQSTVEIVPSGAAPILVHLTGAREDQQAPADAQARLASWLVEDIADPRLRESCGSFATTIMNELLRESHGALLAISAPDGAPTAVTADGIVLPAPDDLGKLVAAHIRDESSAALGNLLAHKNLLGGMLQSDGITLLDTACRIHAFNCFVKATDEDLGEEQQLGGARRRAYGVLCAMVDKGDLRGAFIRSSDGLCQAHGVDQ